MACKRNAERRNFLLIPQMALSDEGKKISGIKMNSLSANLTTRGERSGFCRPGRQVSDEARVKRDRGGNTQTKVLFYCCLRTRRTRTRTTDRRWCISERRASKRVRWSRSGMLHNWLAGHGWQVYCFGKGERLYGLAFTHNCITFFALQTERFPFTGPGM